MMRSVLAGHYGAAFLAKAAAPGFPAPALALGLLVASALACLRAGAIPAARRRGVLVLVGVLAAVAWGARGVDAP